MFTFLSRVNIRARVLFTVALPVLGMLGFATMIAVDSSTRSGEMSDVLELAEVAPYVSGLVHELQKERGTSAGYIGSKGLDVTSDRLKGQHKLTNTALAAFGNTLDGFDTAPFGANLTDRVTKARGNVSKLKAERTKVQSFSNSVPQMAGYYTGTITSLLEIIHEISGLSTDPEVSTATTAYVNLLESKERAGRERAMGAAGFGSGKFQKNIYGKFTSLIAAQGSYLDVFNKNASPEQISFYKATVKGPSVDEVSHMRALAINSAFGGDLEGVTGRVWFDTITRKIDLLKAVEDRVSNDLLAMAGSKQSTAIQTLYLTLAGITALLGAIVFFVRGSVNSIVNPVNGIKQTMRELTDGHFNAVVQGLDQGGEIGEMSAAVEVFKDGLIRAEGLAKEQETQRLEKDARAARLAKHVSVFDKTIVSVLDGLSTVSGTMQTTSESVNEGATDTRTQALNVASAAEETSINVQTVASAAEELAASIAEIGQQVETASKITQKAVGVTDSTGAQIKALDESVSKIGDVVNLINDIASQTNLLALNATIEAARAGDAGKGFAVVASEVKALATQTAQATEEIGGQIAQVQTATTAAVEAIGSITEIVTEVAEISTELSSAIDSQKLATTEIARNGEEAAAATTSVAEAITRVQTAAEDSQTSAKRIAEVSDNLASQSDALKDNVNGFLKNVQENEGSVEDIANLQDNARFDDAKLNQEHENIANYINVLHKSYRSGADAQEMAATFGELKDEVIAHFVREEEYMDEMAYPNLTTHAEEHQAFLTRVLGLYEAYEAREDGAGHALIAFLGTWFNDHVNSQDKSVIEFARSRNNETRVA